MTLACPASLRDTLLTALAPLIWGSTYWVTSQWLPPDRPFTAALLRVLPAGLLLLGWTRGWPARASWGRLLGVSVLNIGVFQALLFVAAYRLPGGVAAILAATPLSFSTRTWLPFHLLSKLKISFAGNAKAGSTGAAASNSIMSDTGA